MNGAHNILAKEPTLHPLHTRLEYITFFSLKNIKEEIQSFFFVVVCFLVFIYVGEYINCQFIKVDDFFREGRQACYVICR